MGTFFCHFAHFFPFFWSKILIFSYPKKNSATNWTGNQLLFKGGLRQTAFHTKMRKSFKVGKVASLNSSITKPNGRVLTEFRFSSKVIFPWPALDFHVNQKSCFIIQVHMNPMVALKWYFTVYRCCILFFIAAHFLDLVEK